MSGNATLLYKMYKAKTSQPHSMLTVSGEMSKGQCDDLMSDALVPSLKLSEKEVKDISMRASDDKLKVLFIGNSITLHPLVEYWWGVWGMAADTAEHDYVHLAVGALAQHANVSWDACNFAAWETMSHDRAETLQLLDSLLSVDDDLIVIQLGENVHDTTTLQKDYEELIRYCRETAPGAKFVMIGNFWTNFAVEQAKRQAAANEQVNYADLEAIRDLPEAESSLGAKVKDRNGDDHEIAHEGVAKHPGNAGMLAIANLLLKAAME